MQNQHFTATRKNTPLSPATSKRDNAERGSELPATLMLDSDETLVNLLTVTLGIHSCNDSGAKRETEERSRKEIVVYL